MSIGLLQKARASDIHPSGRSLYSLPERVTGHARGGLLKKPAQIKKGIVFSCGKYKSAMHRRHDACVGSNIEFIMQLRQQDRKASVPAPGVPITEILPGDASMIFFTQGKTQTGTFVFVFPVEARKRMENSRRILLVKADPVVGQDRCGQKIAPSFDDHLP